MRLDFAQHFAAHCRNKGERDDKARDKRIGDRESHVNKELTGDALDKNYRQEHRDRCEGRGDDRARNLPCAVHRRLYRRVSQSAQAEDVFDHDNRVVNQHSHADRQARKRDHVQRYRAEIHQNYRENQAYRDGNRDDDRRLYVAQEEEQNYNRQNRAHEQVLEHASHYYINVVALVVKGGKAQTLVLFLKGFKLVSDIVADGRGRDIALL